MVYRKTAFVAALVLMHGIGIDIHHIASGTQSAWYTHFVYMFFHVNVFHLALNAYALWHCFSGWRWMLAAYIISVMASFAVTDPVVGFSSAICAVWGMTMLRAGKARWVQMVVVFGASFFIPAVSWQVHLICFALGFMYMLIAQLKYDYRKVIGRK